MIRPIDASDRGEDHEAGHFNKAANQNHTAAQQELGVNYLRHRYTTGNGVANDDAEAIKWVHKVADLGNATAQYNLGLMIAKGAGVCERYALITLLPGT